MRTNRESGQIMVLLVLAFVAMLGFGALAIDVGMVYADRRSDQNAADAAALAGMQQAMQSLASLNSSTFLCNTGGSWVTSTSGWSAPAWLTSGVLNNILSRAQSMAQKNGFSVGLGLNNQNGVAFRCGLLDGAPYAEVGVQISSVTHTSFLHIFSGTSGLRNTVEARSRGEPSQAALAGYALYTLDDNCSDEGIGMVGGGNHKTAADPVIDIQLGGAYSRSCLNANNNQHFFIRADTSISCMAHPGNPYACGTVGQFSPTPGYVGGDPLDFTIATPDCSNRTLAPARTASGDTLEPGYYTSVGSASKLKPGLYCLDIDSGFGKNLSTIDGNGYDEGVTIVFMRAGSGFGGNGNYDWNLKAAKPGGAHNAPGVVPGVVMLSDKQGVSLDFGGNAQTSFWGTVYLPKGSVTMGGTPDLTTTASQIIADHFHANGTAALRIKFDSSWFYQEAPSFSLVK